MANQVFANGRELACKKGSGKTICAFPDVCMTPPENPATPPGIPVPYPNTGSANDTHNGTKKVLISGGEIVLKSKSSFKKSIGDEAGCAAKKGVVSSTNKGEVFFKSWSMNVKFEGLNVARHFDITTNNHACEPGDTPTFLFTERMALMNSAVDSCSDEKNAIKDACGKDGEKAKCPDASYIESAKKSRNSLPVKSFDRKLANIFLNSALESYAINIRKNEDCQRAMRCSLVSHTQGKAGACCSPQTPEHLIPASQFGKDRGADHSIYPTGGGGAASLCAEGGATVATHGLLGGARRRYMTRNGITPGKGTWTVRDSAKCGAVSASEIFKHCRADCLEAQLLKNHEELGIDLDENINTKQNNDDKRSYEFYHKFILGSG